MVHPVQMGKKVRMSFSKIDEVLDMPNLIEVQKIPTCGSLRKACGRCLKIFPHQDYTGNLVLEFLDYYLEDKPKYSVEECKERDVTYSAPLKVRVRLINRKREK